MNKLLFLERIRLLNTKNNIFTKRKTINHVYKHKKTSKTYVFGDIHGCYDEFIELTQKIGITDDDLII